MMSSAIISSLIAYQIYDSRGKPTIEVCIVDSKGEQHIAAVPSGASTGVHEALELRDCIKSEFMGQGVFKAIGNVNDIIAPALLSANIDIFDQNAIDKFLCDLDGSPNKGKLGANAILAVSMAICRLSASMKGLALFEYLSILVGSEQQSLPVPFFNVINGGAHAGNLLAFQEFMIAPTGARTFSEAMKMGAEVYQELKLIIKERHGPDAINVGDEGGFAPNVASPRECLDLIAEAISKAGYDGKISIALDVAASEFYCGDQVKSYNLDIKDRNSVSPNILSGKDLANFYVSLCNAYPIISIEDPFDQDDWVSWKYLRKILPSSIQIVGDDLTVTNPLRILKAVQEKSCNALLLKINQIGTITESIEAAKLAFENGWNVMVSHRSGETEDCFIADMAVALNCGQLKSGAPCRSERVSKYNRLLRIENNYSITLKTFMPPKDINV